MMSELIQPELISRPDGWVLKHQPPDYKSAANMKHFKFQ